MSLAARLALPALIGGILALAASGVFAPPVSAGGPRPSEVARVVGLEPGEGLDVRDSPEEAAEPVAEISGTNWVWVERCEGGAWCLVERAGTRGWVAARHLAPYWD